ncbi:MAG: L-seryl-tRNA(Sec) selenium transferase [candidate division Zixibacteria bacterium]|nr:L-seryl-tRNA(Sec) selenium transferase [candidate division Zixibacteria bacterium]
MIEKPRDFPAVEELLQHEELAEAVLLIPRPAAAEIIKATIANAKAQLTKTHKPITLERLNNDIRKALLKAKRQEITRVINATGIVVHTNLGRAPLPAALFEAVKERVTGYGNIEFDLNTGGRGSRGLACEKYLVLLTGAEAGTVVNNCAAALFLILNTLANRKQVLLSRGEMVQIGGGFRIPDILKKSGGKLCEVGTTNITTIKDYEDNIETGRSGLILKVHKSNFVQSGFTEEANLKELVTLGRKYGWPVVNDLGSGVFIDTRDILGYEEPTVGHSVRAGVDLTSFSGDKLLGGVQAGLIVGSSEYIKKIKRNPLFRTMRVDKVVFSIVEHLLSVYLSGDFQTDIHLWQILSIAESDLYQRGQKILSDLGHPSGLSVEATKAFVGGGSMPEADIPSVGIVFSTAYSATRLMRQFRNRSLPIIGRIENDQLILDLKAISENDLSILTTAIKEVIE